MTERIDILARKDGASLPFPPDPIAAVRHADPYPYYADLLAKKPLYRDAALGVWVASSAKAVTAVLTSERCRVRPPIEQVPKELSGSAAGEIFRHLVRMNDGRGHCPFKQAVLAATGSIDIIEAARQSCKSARYLSGKLMPQVDRRRLLDFAFELPVYVVASLLGIPQIKLAQTALWIGDFVRCLAQGSSCEQMTRGKLAAEHLLELVGSRFVNQQGSPASLLAALGREAMRVGLEDASVVSANAIGFITQAYEATAGLIGNTLLTLATHGELRELVRAEPNLLGDVVREVARYDPPIQNTRRFVAESGIVAGQEMKESEAILVVLAAANRDPAANPFPAQFDIFRKTGRNFTFGVGVHRCPGEALATTIAKAGIQELLHLGIDPDTLADSVSYRASANARIPVFDAPAKGDG